MVVYRYHGVTSKTLFLATLSRGVKRSTAHLVYYALRRVRGERA